MSTSKEEKSVTNPVLDVEEEENEETPSDEEVAEAPPMAASWNLSTILSTSMEENIAEQEHMIQEPSSSILESGQDLALHSSHVRESINQETSMHSVLVQENQDPLRHVQNVLGLDEESRERMRLEGITQVEHLYDIEYLLREGKVSGLKSVETVKLIHFISWTTFFQKKARGSLPDPVADFTVDEYNRFVKRERSKVRSYVWPFLGIWEVEDEPKSAPQNYDDHDLALDEEQVGKTMTMAAPPKDLRSARLRENFDRAEEAHRDFHEGSGMKKDLKNAIDKYRLVVLETPVSIEDSMLQAFACIKLGVLLQRVEFKNDREAMEVLEKSAVQFKLPAGMFFYGNALVNGTGGVVKDIPRGIAMLNDAAAEGIGEAYFQLGNIYEGGTDGVNMDLSVARDFYNATSMAIQPSGRKKQDGWKQMLVGMTHLFAHQGAYKMPVPTAQAATHWQTEISAVKHLIISEGWHNAEGVFVSVVGERFNWGLAGQAFLFGASVVLTQTVQAHHYPALLPIIPVLGMMLAFFSIMQTMEGIWRNVSKRGPVRQMHRAKLNAFRKMLHVGAWHMAFIPPFHYLLLLWYGFAYFFMRCCSCTIRMHNSLGFHKRSEKLDAKYLWVQTWGYTSMLQNVTGIIEILVLFISVAFFLAWLILFTNEYHSYRDDCSNWWHNTCMGSNVTCFDREHQNQCEAFFQTEYVPPPTPTMFPTAFFPSDEPVGDPIPDPFA